MFGIDGEILQLDQRPNVTSPAYILHFGIFLVISSRLLRFTLNRGLMDKMETKRCGKSKLLVEFEWSVEDTFKLIAAVRSIYSYESTMDNIISNEQSWIAVAKQFPNFNANECKAQWQVLRAQQRRIIRENKVTETK